MNFRRYLILIMIALTMPLCGIAQEQLRQIYNQAESDYEIGRIEQACELLQENLPAFTGNLRQSAYRLLALCYMSLDQEEKARYYAELLVKYNNYYNSADDPARFQDLIYKLKQGIATTISTASGQDESISEAPVPITIITAEMIEELGYNKNLNQILSAYVPGMAEITSEGALESLAMHGAYADNQAYILIMENGHRLNNRYDNNGPTGYSISTEKIDHIEVLRGPASSLYGNVALSAVVNIITKSGRSVNGVKMKYGNATFQTHRADLLMGTQFMDADINVWVSVYSSDGQIRHFNDGEGYLSSLQNLTYSQEEEEGYSSKSIFLGPDKIYVGRYKHSPSFDVGLTFKLKGFDFMFSKKRSTKAYEISEFGGYDYERYPTVNGYKPGYTIDFTHGEIGYTRQINGITLNASVYGDWYSFSNYSIEGDSIVEIVRDNIGTIDETCDTTTVLKGHFSIVGIHENTFGGFFKAYTNYHLGTMKGNILAGIQYEYFSLYSRQTCIGDNFHEIYCYTNFQEAIKKGKEKILSFFVQDKHYFMPQIILNAGLRYDIKYRIDEDALFTLSPRLSLMYVPSNLFSLKLSYSEAFADLAFHHRYFIQNADYRIDPQHLSSMQLSAMGIINPLHLNYEVNLFYNHYSNLLCWHARDEIDNDIDPYYQNMGKLKNVGVEVSASYAYKRLSGLFTFYYCHDISSSFYYYNKQHEIVNNVPHLTMNLHGAWKLLQGKKHEVKFYGHGSYTGKKLNLETEEKKDFFVDGKMLFDLGIKYGYRQKLQLSLDCENILNTDSYLCGSRNIMTPIFQRGRTFMASFSYKF